MLWHDRVSRMRGALGVLVCLTLGILGCGGGGGAQAAAPVPPPVTIGLTATPDRTDFDRVVLTWMLPQGTETLRLEYRLEDGAYQGLADPPISSERLILTFAPGSPELMTFGFRLTALKAGQPLAQAETTYRRTLRPAQDTTWTTALAGEAVGFQWAKDPTSVATGFLLERMSETGGWTTVAPAVQVGTSRFVAGDMDASKEGDIPYRVVPTYGSERGLAPVIVAAKPMRAPVDLSASPSGPGWDLSWTNRSKLATGLRVYRSDLPSGTLNWKEPVLLAELGPTQSRFQDPAPPEGTRVAYRVASVPPNPKGWESASAWCLPGGSDRLESLGLTRRPLALPWFPLTRDLGGGWVGTRGAAMKGLPSQLTRIPDLPGFSLQLPSLNPEFYASPVYCAFPGPDGALDVGMVDSTGSTSSPLVVVGARWSAGAWRVRTFSISEGLSASRLGFGQDGTAMAATVDASWRRGFLRLAMDGSITQDLDPFSGRIARYMSPPRGTPTGEALVLVRFQNAWSLAIRAKEGTWTLQNLQEVDPAYQEYSCMDTTVDLAGNLHALFALTGPGGFRVAYLRVAPGGSAVFEELGTGQEDAWGQVGSLAVSSDGQKVGWALMSDLGQLRTGLRIGSAAWVLRTSAVPDARIDYRSPFLLCGFRSDGRFWVLHDEVSHPTAETQSQYFELLEAP